MSQEEQISTNWNAIRVVCRSSLPREVRRHRIAFILQGIIRAKLGVSLHSADIE